MPVLKQKMVGFSGSEWDDRYDYANKGVMGSR